MSPASSPTGRYSSSRNAQIRFALRLLQHAERAHLGAVLGAGRDLRGTRAAQLREVGPSVAIGLERGQQPRRHLRCRSAASHPSGSGMPVCERFGLVALLLALRSRARAGSDTAAASAMPRGTNEKRTQPCWRWSTSIGPVKIDSLASSSFRKREVPNSVRALDVRRRTACRRRRRTRPQPGGPPRRSMPTTIESSSHELRDVRRHAQRADDAERDLDVELAIDEPHRSTETGETTMLDPIGREGIFLLDRAAGHERACAAVAACRDRLRCADRLRRAVRPA